MSKTSVVALVSFLAALLACKGGTPEDTAEPCDYNGPQWVCRNEGEVIVYQVDSCGVETTQTERCLNDDVCVQPGDGTDAYCGYADGCIPDGTSEAICDPENERYIIQVDSCGVEERRLETCLGDWTCHTTTDGDPYCACPIPDEPVLWCNPADSETEQATLQYVDECDQFLPEVIATCAVGEYCWYTWNEDGTVDESAGAHCGSSMDPSQSDSPWYQYACDLDMYMHATTSLIMDCRCNRSNAAMQECRPGSDAWGQGLRLGTGPNMHGINFAKWGGGFILNGELYAPVRYSGGTSGDDPGAIYAIDIVTGNRRVVSGSYLSSTGRVDVGSGHLVNGEALPFLTHIKLGADGMIYAFGSNTLSHVEITRVHPITGARTQVWRRVPESDGMNASYPYGQCFDGRPSSLYLGGYQPVQYAERAFALGEDGSFYVGWNNDGVGVVRISADGSTCTQVSRWASRNLTAPLPDIGGGITPQYDTIQGMLHRDGKIYAFTEEMLLSINDVTGDRSIFSYVSGIGGNGETNFWVDESRNVMFACGTVAARKCSVHDMVDGNVAQNLFEIGQEYPVIQGKYPFSQGAKGALDNNNYSGYGAVAMDPNDNNILYFVVLSGVIKYEIDTGNSHFISM